MTSLESYGEFVDQMLGERSKRTWDDTITTAALGLAGETGEVVDLVKKLVYHGRPTDPDMRAAMLKELGDVRWYYQLMLNSWGFTDDEVKATNMAKLLSRYPEGTFSQFRDQNRNPEV